MKMVGSVLRRKPSKEQAQNRQPPSTSSSAAPASSQAVSRSRKPVAPAALPQSPVVSAAGAAALRVPRGGRQALSGSPPSTPSSTMTPVSSVSVAAAPEAQVQTPEVWTGPYALPDDEYMAWKRAQHACSQAPSSVEPLKELASRKPKLLNYRSPLTKRTLLEEMALKGASPEAIEQAQQLGCEDLPQSFVAELKRKKEAEMAPPPPEMEYGRRSRARVSSRRLTPSMEVAMPSRQLPVPASSGIATPPEQLFQRLPSQELVQQQQQQFPAQQQQLQLPDAAAPSSSSLSAAPAAVAPLLSVSKRKAGYKMKEKEVTRVPRASMNIDFNIDQEEDLDAEAFQAAMQKTYGGTARVQIDEVQDVDSSSTALKPSSSGPSSGWNLFQRAKRSQNIKCRVLFDEEDEARQWQRRANSLTGADEFARAMAQELGQEQSEMNLGAAAAAQLDEVDAITLKLDSDSSAILCGACLLFSASGECKKVVCYCDRMFAGGAVQHSGDTQVDGKSVHTIQLVQSKIPPEISQLYFTLCSCGNSDLSGFKDPSIMLYQNSQPDANLVEYSINQAKKNMSCVMGRMVRKPTWNPEQAVVVRLALRRMKLPFLCIDIIMAMAADSYWDIEGLGTSEWNIKEKVCQSYHYAKDLIKKRLDEEGTSKDKPKKTSGPEQLLTRVSQALWRG